MAGQAGVSSSIESLYPYAGLTRRLISSQPNRCPALASTLRRGVHQNTDLITVDEVVRGVGGSQEVRQPELSSRGGLGEQRSAVRQDGFNRDHCRAAGCRRDRGVSPRASVDGVRADATKELIVPVVALQIVVAILAEQNIIAGSTTTVTSSRDLPGRMALSSH